MVRAKASWARGQGPETGASRPAAPDLSGASLCPASDFNSAEEALGPLGLLDGQRCIKGCIGWFLAHSNRPETILRKYSQACMVAPVFSQRAACEQPPNTELSGELLLPERACMRPAPPHPDNSSSLRAQTGHPASWLCQSQALQKQVSSRPTAADLRQGLDSGRSLSEPTPKRRNSFNSSVLEPAPGVSGCHHKPFPF